MAAKNMRNIRISCIIWLAFCWLVECDDRRQPLRFGGKTGEFRILQVADMHYADGWKTPCEDVFPQQMPSCSDLNTTAFIRRLILAERPDLIVFTGDNIFGFDASNPETSMNAAFAPAMLSNIPWAAVLGNHDQESTLSREDSGDYSTIPSIPGYGWIKPSQQFWFQRTSLKLKRSYMKKPEPQKAPAPGLVYFHIPLPEYASFDSSNFTGVKQEGISSASINSGFFTTMVEAGDVKAAFTGHDHLNDFCGELTGIHLCYAGGFGYHAYGKAGWARRARMVVASLEKTEKEAWGTVKSIKTWKRLDDDHLTAIDSQVLWSKRSNSLFVENEFQEMVVKQGLIPLEMVGAREGLKRPRSPDSAIKSGRRKKRIGRL
ncbi:probable inactive purple acid phosphatase 29 isoform X5 [Olea europaea var. sylvestris]|uniref:probable inactive purple acid phosphatase 29 isoform X5 n=1 Tax=Olea europaea var. sylvestris TaxID=158386 RepID=UPI000C1D4C20|nr:probable inactive purple acid phosphatase 29 isoform X5 [Olea europaea var. sylvestris]